MTTTGRVISCPISSCALALISFRYPFFLDGGHLGYLLCSTCDFTSISTTRGAYICFLGVLFFTSIHPFPAFFPFMFPPFFLLLCWKLEGRGRIFFFFFWSYITCCRYDNGVGDFGRILKFTMSTGMDERTVLEFFFRFRFLLSFCSLRT
jgi:hypothetical protein